MVLWYDVNMSYRTHCWCFVAFQSKHTHVFSLRSGFLTFPASGRRRHYLHRAFLSEGALTADDVVGMRRRSAKAWSSGQRIG